MPFYQRRGDGDRRCQQRANTKSRGAALNRLSFLDWVRMRTSVKINSDPLSSDTNVVLEIENTKGKMAVQIVQSVETKEQHHYWENSIFGMRKQQITS